jgi:hypothetical protein
VLGHAALILLLPWACRKTYARKEPRVFPCCHCETAKHRVVPSSKVGDFLTTGSKTTSYACARLHMSPQRSGTLSSTPLALLHRSPPLPLSPHCPPRPRPQADVAPKAVPKKKAKAKEGSLQGLNHWHPNIVHPISVPFPLARLLPVLMIRAHVLVIVGDPNVFFSPSSSSRSQGPISISSSTIGRELLCIS